MSILTQCKFEPAVMLQQDIDEMLRIRLQAVLSGQLLVLGRSSSAEMPCSWVLKTLRETACEHGSSEIRYVEHFSWRCCRVRSLCLFAASIFQSNFSKLSFSAAAAAAWTREFFAARHLLTFLMA